MSAVIAGTLLMMFGSPALASAGSVDGTPEETTTAAAAASLADAVDDALCDAELPIEGIPSTCEDEDDEDEEPGNGNGNGEGNGNGNEPCPVPVGNDCNPGNGGGNEPDPTDPPETTDPCALNPIPETAECPPDGIPATPDVPEPDDNGGSTGGNNSGGSTGGGNGGSTGGNNGNSGGSQGGTDASSPQGNAPGSIGSTFDPVFGSGAMNQSPATSQTPTSGTQQSAGAKLPATGAGDNSPAILAMGFGLVGIGVLLLRRGYAARHRA